MLAVILFMTAIVHHYHCRRKLTRTKLTQYCCLHTMDYTRLTTQQSYLQAYEVETFVRIASITIVHTLAGITFSTLLMHLSSHLQLPFSLKDHHKQRQSQEIRKLY